MNLRNTIKVILPAISLIFLCTGCLIYDLNAGQYQRYYESGLSHLRAENYSEAKKSFAICIHCAESGYLGPAVESAAWYNYAIAVGHLGNFQQAEGCFKRAMIFDEKADGTNSPYTTMRLFELARLYQAWGKNSQAVEMYEKAFSISEKNNYEKNEPLNYAVVLDDYASVLEKAGFASKAENARMRARTIRNEHVGETVNIPFRYYPAK